MWEYGCVKCQTWHREDEPIYAEHLCWQSKHGPRFVPVEQAIIQAAMLAGMKCEKPTNGKSG